MFWKRLVLFGRILAATALLTGAQPGRDPKSPGGEPPAGKSVDHGKGAEKAASLPWKLDTPYRYVWIRGTTKVGETRFTVRRTREGDAPALEVRSRRSYDHAGVSQRARATTRLLLGGAPVRYEESLDFTTLRKMRGHQDTIITVQDRAAHVRFDHGEHARSKPVVEFDLHLSPGAYLCANQAVEHWAIFLASARLTARTSTVRLFYPDFREVLVVKFEKGDPEVLTLGGRQVATTLYQFRSEKGRLKGSVWLDKKQRLIKIQFPPTSARTHGLKVVLATDTGAVSR